MFDISAVNSSIQFTGGLETTINQFSDEGTPFEAPDIEVSENAKNLNGEMISSRKPSVYTLSVTVIPMSDNDKDLQNFLQKSAIFPGNYTDIKKLWCDCTVTIPGQNGEGTRTYKYFNGRIKSGPTGPSTSAEGRMAARTYTFEFEQFSQAIKSGKVNKAK